MKIISKFIFFVFIYLLLLFLEWGLGFFYETITPLARYYPLGLDIANKTLNVKQREYQYLDVYNTYGFRGKDFNLKKEAGKKRILFLGDSFVAGQGVAIEERTTAVLQNRLNNDLPVYDIVNVGQVATNPVSYVDNFMRFGIALQPDIIVCGIFLGNDFSNSRLYKSPKLKSSLENKDAVTSEIDIDKYDAGDLFSCSRIRFLMNSFLRNLSGKILSFDYRQLNFCKKYFYAVINRVFADNRIAKKYILRQSYTSLNFWDVYFRQKIDKAWFYNTYNLSNPVNVQKLKNIPQDVITDMYQGYLNPGLMSVLFSKKQKEEKIYYLDDDVENVVDMMTFLRDYSAVKDIEFVVLIYPSIYQMNSSRYSKFLKENCGYTAVPNRLLELEGVSEKFKKSLTEKNIKFVELKPFLEYDDYHQFDSHLNAAGNRKVSEVLYAFLNNTRD